VKSLKSNKNSCNSDVTMSSLVNVVNFSNVFAFRVSVNREAENTAINLHHLLLLLSLGFLKICIHTLNLWLAEISGGSWAPDTVLLHKTYVK